MRAFYCTCICVITCMATLRLPAQSLHDEPVCPAKTPKQIKRQIRKKRVLNGVNKTLIYVSYLSYSDRQVDRPVNGPEEYEPYRGKTIRNIDIQIIEPYGTTIDKPVADHYSKFQKFANKIQIKTKDWVVRNDLLFKQGEKVDPMQIADTERNLWDRGTFKDLKVFIEPVQGEDSVDVVIMLQDRWSWGVKSTLAYSYVSAGLEFKNFLGLPQTVFNSVTFNFRKDDFYSLSGGYLFENIKKSHIDARVSYEYDNLNKGVSGYVQRNFFSANSEWAGHLMGSYQHQSAALPNSLGQAIPTNVTYDNEDAWLARAFKLPSSLGQSFDLMRLIVSGRMYRNQYDSRPYQVSPDGSLIFLNRTYALGSIGLANWDYYLDHSVYYLDQAEYFGKGFNPSLIMGWDNDEQLGQRFYSGVQLDYGKYLQGLGYFDTRVSYGGFSRKDMYDQVLFKVTENYYSTPVKLGRRFMLRQFITGNVNIGVNRPDTKQLVMNDADGVRGIFVNNIQGTRSYVVNLETDVYPTFKILGFSGAAFAFADLALMQQNSFKGGTLTQGYGVGLKLRNLGMGIGFFEITFAYYPKLSIQTIKPYAVIGGFDNSRAISADNLFVPTVLSTDR
jgi:hypothetical protein